MASQEFLPPAAWHASLAGVVVSAAALISDGDGRVLVVKPNYRDYWTLPGGICEFAEAPQAGCIREVTEELGVAVRVSRLLAVDWQLPQDIYGPQARPAVFFIFDCGVLPTLSQVRLQADELDDCLFAAEPDLGALLAPPSLPRVRMAVAALESGCAQYVPSLTGSG